MNVMRSDTEECFPGGLSYCPGEAAFPLSTDTMVLADLVPLKRGGRVIDLGSAAGALGLLLCGREPACTVTGLELDHASHEAALGNIERNLLQGRLSSVWGDIRRARELFPAGSFTCAVSNPPYYSSGAGHSTHPGARQEQTCTLDDIFAAARWLLPTGGDLCLVHKPERLGDLLYLSRHYGLETKTLTPVCHRQADAPAMVVLHCRRGGKPGLRFLPSLVLFDPEGSPTEDYKRIYHLK